MCKPCEHTVLESGKKEYKVARQNLFMSRQVAWLWKGKWKIPNFQWLPFISHQIDIACSFKNFTFPFTMTGAPGAHKVILAASSSFLKQINPAEATCLLRIWVNLWFTALLFTCLGWCDRCISVSFLEGAIFYVLSSCLPEWMYSHTGCNFFTSLFCVF